MEQWVKTAIYELKRRRAYLLDRASWPVPDAKNCKNRVKRINTALNHLTSEEIINK